MELSCADFTWPAVSHDLALDIIRGIGFGAVDIGYFAGRSHVRPEEVGPGVADWAARVRERCERRGLAVADLFAQPEDFQTLAVNHPDEGERRRSLAFFDACLEFARGLGSPGITILPGVAFGDEENRRAMERAAEGLRERVERAAGAGLRLSVEPHLGSITDTPARTVELMEQVPGLMLTLDYGHFVSSGFGDDEIEPLTGYAGHVHCRGGAPGRLQTDMRSNRIDFPRMVRALAAHGFEGHLTAEYVWSEWQRCNEVDNLTETVALFDLLSAALTEI